MLGQTPSAGTREDAVSNIDGAALLDEVRAAIRRYCILPGEHELVGVTLWCALSHLLAEFDYAPRLVIRSAEKRSGKSRLLEVIDGLVYSPLRAVNTSVSYVFRSLGTEPPPTLLFDEADTIFGSKVVSDRNEELRGLLNAGFQRGLSFGRVQGQDHSTQEFATFAMAALAGIGRMPETIEDRAVVVVMKRRRAEERVQPYRLRRDGPLLHGLRDRLAQWADTVRERAGETYPELPVDDRAADVWEPLVSVADLAGGAWPQLARDAALALVDFASEDDTARSPGLQLLADIRTVFDTEFMKSDELCRRLRELTESPWEQLELNPSKLGGRLREYSITTRHSADKSERGYYLRDFTDAFARYLPSEKASEDVQRVQGDVKQDITTSRPSPDRNRSDRVQDGPDTMGRLLERQPSQPSPGDMPQRRATAVTTSEQPRHHPARRNHSGPGR